MRTKQKVERLEERTEELEAQVRELQRRIREMSAETGKPTRTCLEHIVFGPKETK